MAIQIFRHEIPPFRDTNVFEVKLHAGAAIIYIDQIKIPPHQSRSRGLATGERATILDSQNGKPVYEYYMWAVENSALTLELRRFWFVRDGDRLDVLGDDAALFHITSFRATDGILWSHVFEISHLPDDFVPDQRRSPAAFHRRPGRVQRSGAGDTRS